MKKQRLKRGNSLLLVATFTATFLMLGGLLVGCGGKDITKTQSADNVSVNKKKVTQTEEQKAIKTSQDHFDYIASHQDKVVDQIENLDNEMLNQEDNKKLTENAFNIFKELNRLADEYINFDNKLTETAKADEYYKNGMKGLNKFVSENEKSLKDGTYVQHETGVDYFMNSMENTLDAYYEFKEMSIDVGF